MINQYIIYKFNLKYAEMYVKDYYLQCFIQIDFVKFKARYFDELNNATQKVVKDYYYKSEF